jgi:hypothetical protein
LALSVFDVLDAATVSQKLPQRRLAFHIRPTSQILAIEHQEIESHKRCTFIVEVRNPIQADPDNLGCGAFDCAAASTISG